MAEQYVTVSFADDPLVVGMFDTEQDASDWLEANLDGMGYVTLFTSRDEFNTHTKEVNA